MQMETNNILINLEISFKNITKAVKKISKKTKLFTLSLKKKVKSNNYRKLHGEPMIRTRYLK